MRARFIGAILILFIALFLTARLFPFLGFYADFILAALVTFATFLNFLEIVFLTLLAAFFVNWQPVPSAEMLIFIILPLAAFWIGRAANWRPWFTAPLAVVLTLTAMYLAFGRNLLLGEPRVFAYDVVLALAFGVLSSAALTKISA